MQHSVGTYFTFFVMFGLVGAIFVMTAFMFAGEPTGSIIWLGPFTRVFEVGFVIFGGAFGLFTCTLSLVHLLNMYLELYDRFWSGSIKTKSKK
jgi:hypothetical protein